MSFDSVVTGVSGLTSFQSSLNVIGNNLANASTTGFKSGQAGFADLFYQTLSPATAPSGTTGGTNPLQNGFGVKLNNIESNLTQGSLQPSGSNLDFGIQGQGFFVVNNGAENLFTRNGSFSIDSNGFLVDPATGSTVQRFGTVGEGSATTQAFQTPGDNRIKILLGTGVPGVATSTVTMQGNLSATAAVGTTTNAAIQVFDTQGTSHALSLVFTKTAANTWSLAGSIPAADGTLTTNTVGPMTFNANGSLIGATNVTMTAQFTGIAAAQNITFNLGTANGFDGLTQFGGTSSAAALSQNGFAAGSLSSVTASQDGTISGVFTNGQTLPIAQMAIASFANPGGLTRVGNNDFNISGQSGPALIGAGQTGARGSVQQGTLEASNVNVSLELTNLIIAQQAFDANARTITVSNQILQTLVGIIPLA